MKIIVGSITELKITAVKEAIKQYDFLSDAEVIGMYAPSEVSEEPKSIDETTKGAMNRAKNAFQDCEYSFGIEDGFIKIPNTKTGFMLVSVCAIYDGENFHIGLSSAFEYPVKIMKLIMEKGLSINEAFYESGLTENTSIGKAEGTIGMLTKGRLPRKEYTKQGISMALIQLENPDIY